MERANSLTVHAWLATKANALGLCFQSPFELPLVYDGEKYGLPSGPIEPESENTGGTKVQKQPSKDCLRLEKPSCF